MVKRRQQFQFAVVPMALIYFAHPLQASLITNGGFENVGTQTASYSVQDGNGKGDAPLSGWTVGNYTNTNYLDCVMLSGQTTGLCGPNNSGPGNSTWQFSTYPGLSPDGGNFFGMDGDSNFVAPLSQTISGLTAGAQYVLTFYQAAAQQNGFSGATTEQWQVSFGGSTQTSALMNNPDGGATAWALQTLTFTADSTSDVLSFLGLGTPNGQPPFVLLDGVDVEAAAAPEPATLGLLAAGILAFPMVLRMRKRAR